MNENENAHANSTANINATSAANALTHAFINALGSNSMPVACRTTPNAGNEIGEESIPDKLFGAWAVLWWWPTPLLRQDCVRLIRKPRPRLLSS
jgi:hypothetical protein